MATTEDEEFGAAYKWRKSTKPAPVDIEPFRKYLYNNKYFKKGAPVLTGYTSDLSNTAFEPGMISIPKEFVHLLNGDEKKIDVRDTVYPIQ